MPLRSNLLTVFVYEFRMIIRSWVYRFMVPVAPGAVILFAALVYLNPERTWDWFALPATLPYTATLIATALLSFAGAFAGADMVHRDRTLNTIQSLHTRPVSNESFVAGKLLALICALGLLEALALFAALAVNLFARELPVQWEAYLLYPLLMTLPAVVFTAGLSFSVATRIGSAMPASLVVWVLVVMSVAVPFTSLGSLPDLTGFHIPLIFSDIAGFGNLPMLLMQRGMFLISGMGLAAVSVLTFPRLSARKRQRRWTGMSAVVLLLAGVLLGTTFAITSRTGANLREQMRILNERYADMPTATVTACDLDVVHRGASIHASAAITVTNATDEPLASYVFSLNPGLDVESVAAGGDACPYRRDLHILDMAPSRPLEPGETDTVKIAYHGIINEDACYTDIGEDERMLPYGFLCCDIAKRYAFIEPDFVLLTPETLWYPMAGVPFGALFPAAQNRDFIDFSLTVNTGDNLTVLSQGTAATVSPGVTRFTPETPLPGLSLVIGEYDTRTVEVDRVAYSLYVKAGHDVFTNSFEELRGDALSEWIRDYKSDFESPFGGVYPYHRFALVEVPVQFYAYPRLWSGEMQTVRPEMVFLPEKGYSCFKTYGDFATTLTDAGERFSERRTREDIEDQMLMVFLTNSLHWIDFNTDIVHSDNTPNLLLNKKRARVLSYGMHPLYSLFQVHARTADNAAISSFFEKYIHYKTWGADSAINSIAFRYLSDKSLETVLSDAELQSLARLLLRVKTDEFFAVLQTKTGEEWLQKSMQEFIARHRYTCCELDLFAERIRESCDIDLDAELHDWYTRIGIPGYVITDSHAERIEHDGRTFVQASLTIHNLEHAPGVVYISGIESGNAREYIWSTYTTQLAGNQSKRIGMVFDDDSLIQLYIDTFLSKNIPNHVNMVFSTENTAIPGIPFHGEEILPMQFEYTGPGEVIVDNEDPGFEIVRSHPRRRFIRSLFGREDVPVIVPYTFFGYAYDSYPEWRYVQNDEFFGLYAKTAYMISGGHGDTAVRWTADLPETGEYDVYYYSCYFDLNEIFNDALFERYNATHLKGIPTIGDYHFIVHDTGGPMNVVLNMPELFRQQNPTEAHLGTFTFDKGAAVIELTNETDGVYVFADAVKWVKR